MIRHRRMQKIPFIAAALFGIAPLHATELSPAGIERAVAAQLPSAFALYRELLAYPNDANDPQAILRLVDRLETEFRARDFQTTRITTPGSPLLLAERSFPGAAHTALVYLQADGQPVDPSQWEQDSPWTPVLKERAANGEWREIPWQRLTKEHDPEWRVFARSAADSKGPVAQFLVALQLLDEAGIRPDVNLKVIVDTQEEQGSPHLPDAVQQQRQRLAADMLLIFDGPPHNSGLPSLVFGARGIATATLTTHGPRVPVHSGHYGNYVPNPAIRLAELIASLQDDTGRVVIPGWYDGVSLNEAERAILAAVPDDGNAIRNALGIAASNGVAESLQESIQYPSLNVRGMRAAWTGADVRTVIPATATAEFDIRLVPESDPERLIGLLREHIEEQGYHLLDRAPDDDERMRHARLATFTSSIAYGAFRTPFDSLPGRWTNRALTKLNGEPPIRIRNFGGSIPIAPFVQVLGIPAVVVPTVNPDNNQHSPNENLRLKDFVRGIETMVAVLQEPLESE